MTSEHVHLGDDRLQREFRKKLGSTLRGWRSAAPVDMLGTAGKLRYRILHRQFRERPVAVLRWSMSAARWVLQKYRQVRK